MNVDMVCRLISAEEARPLRQLVMRPGLPAAASAYRGDDDEGTFHAGAISREGAIVGIVSFYRDPYPERPHRPAMGFRGMAVDPALQRSGIGRELLAWALDEVRRRGGIELVWCNARTRAVPFYERLGFQSVGQEFVTEFGPHFSNVSCAPISLKPATG
jgi:GNAT superfamily N-acetyltransferase